MSNTITRAEKVDVQIDVMLAPYRHTYDLLSDHARAAVVCPEEVEAAIRQRVAKTGRIRFKKAKPPAYTDDGTGRGTNAPNVGFLFWTLKEHTGYGAYLPIDSLMMCNAVFGRETYRRWEATVDALYALDKGVNIETVAARLETYAKGLS